MEGRDGEEKGETGKREEIGRQGEGERERGREEIRGERGTGRMNDRRDKTIVNTLNERLK